MVKKMNNYVQPENKMPIDTKETKKRKDQRGK